MVRDEPADASSSPPGPQRKPGAEGGLRGWLVTLGTAAAYAAAYGPLERFLGVGAVPLGVIPILAAAWYFGIRGGLVGALGMVALGNVLAVSHGVTTIAFLWGPVNIVRTAAALVVGVLLGAMRDLSIRVTAQAAALSEQDQRRRLLQQHLEEAQEVAGLGSWAMDLPGGPIWLSDGMPRLLGLPEHFQPTLASCLALVHPDDQARVVDAARLALLNDRLYEDELRVVRGDGSLANLKIRCRLAHDSDGGRSRFVGVAQDVTDLRSSEENRRLAEARRQDVEHLLALNRFKSQFVSAAAHELNTPMTPLILQLAILREKQTGPLNEAQHRSVNILDRNIRRLAGLLRDLLDASRIEGKGLELVYSPVHVSTLAKEAVESFEPAAAKAGVALKARIRQGPSQWGDARRISQVLDNLLSNAIKFTPAGGSVVVEGSTAPAGYRIRIQDDGIGFNAEQRARLFQPFSQVHGVDHAVKGGTGLGLFICKGIVEQHGGTIGATSKGPGCGATFEIFLPPAPATGHNGNSEPVGANGREPLGAGVELERPRHA